jgi:transcriptional regulator with XRE-family HTH domain
MARLSDRAAGAVGSLGEYLAEQRRHAQLSLRQLSDLAGVSNPYLSQIERGLRKPSADVLQQLAKALRISAETLYIRAGILDPDESSEGRQPSGVVDAVLLDPALNERQKRVLLDVYASFVRENSPPGDVRESAPPGDVGENTAPDEPGTSTTE